MPEGSTSEERVAAALAKVKRNSPDHNICLDVEEKHKMSGDERTRTGVIVGFASRLRDPQNGQIFYLARVAEDLSFQEIRRWFIWVEPGQALPPEDWNEVVHHRAIKELELNGSGDFMSRWKEIKDWYRENYPQVHEWTEAFFEEYGEEDCDHHYHNDDSIDFSISLDGDLDVDEIGFSNPNPTMRCCNCDHGATLDELRGRTLYDII